MTYLLSSVHEIALLRELGHHGGPCLNLGIPVVIDFVASFFYLTFRLATLGAVQAQSIDPYDVATSGAMSLSSPGPARAASNPAWGAWGQGQHILMSGSWNGPALDNTNLTPSGPSRSGMKPDSYQAEKAESQLYGNLGLDLRPINRFGLSVAIKMPTNHLASLQSFSGEEANYLFFDKRSDRPEIYTAASFALLPQLAIGAGIFHSFKAQGQIQLAASDEDADVRMAMELLPDFIPYFSLAWRSNAESLTSFWALGARYRAEGEAPSEIEIDTSFNIDGVGSFPLSTGSKLVAFYDPETISAGIGRVEQNWQLHLSWDFQKWSHYKSPVVMFLGRDLTNLTGGTVDYDPVTLRDTHRLALGGTVNWGEENKRWIWPWGMGFEQGALPKTPTSLSTLDNDKWSLSTGLGKQLVMTWPSELALELRAGARFIKIKEENFTFTNAQGVQKSAHIGGHQWELSAGGSFVF